MEKRTTEMKDVKGTIQTRPLTMEELGDVSNVNSEYVLIYLPTSKDTIPIYWAKRGNTNVILFSYNHKDEVGIATIDEVRKLVFVDEGNQEHKYKWTQWLMSIQRGEVDSNIQMDGIDEQKFVRTIPKKDISEDMLLDRLCKGFSTPDLARRLLNSFGYKLVPMQPVAA
jgi:hypothetical protein